MPPLLRRVLTELITAALALFIVFGLFFGSVAFLERSASRKARAFCQTVAVGADSTGLAERALATGASTRQTRWGRVNGRDVLFATFTGFTPVSRYICQVEASHGRVVSRQVFYLD